MQTLANVEWPTLVLGVLIGIPVTYIIAILAHMHAPKFVQYLEQRKLLKTHKTKQQALRLFNRIKAFREGTKDKYAYYILLASGGIMCAVAGSMLILIFSIANYDKYAVSIEYLLVVMIGAFAVTIEAVLLGGIYETARQLERFDDYKREFEKQWGPIDV